MAFGVSFMRAATDHGSSGGALSPRVFRAGRATVATPSKSGRASADLRVPSKSIVSGRSAGTSVALIFIPPFSSAPVEILAVWRTPWNSKPPSAL